MKYLFLIFFIQSHFLIAQELPELVGHAGTEDDYESLYISLNGGCSLSCGIGWTIEASSSLSAQGANNYNPSNLSDGKNLTAWVEGKDGYGIGEKLLIQFKNGEEPVVDLPFRSIGITNGYAKSEEIWKANSRVKRFKLYLNSSAIFILELEDSRYPQWVLFETPLNICSGDKLELEILEVYPGTKWKDTAISDISLFGAH